MGKEKIMRSGLAELDKVLEENKILEATAEEKIQREKIKNAERLSAQAAKNVFTAEEARKVSNTSNYALKHIYKGIRDMANENMVKTYWCVQDFSAIALKAIIEDLTANGYTANLLDDDSTLEISW